VSAAIGSNPQCSADKYDDGPNQRTAPGRAALSARPAAQAAKREAGTRRVCALPPPRGACRRRGDRVRRNWIAALIRIRAGRRLDSAALIADGAHARADAYVSLVVIASAVVVAVGVPIADPLIGLAITLVILRITWRSWGTIRGGERRHAH
jgi:hypothetical protein